MWKVAARPEGENTGGENKGGIVVYLVNESDAREEVKRVAFDRDASSAPEIPFDDALKLALETAIAGRDFLNGLHEEAEALA